MKHKLYNEDNIKSLKKIPDNSIDSVVTDPPYGLSFMNKKWDYSVPSIELWKEVYRVLKPGGHVLSFGGTRTYHRMVVNMEDAGFEIRDQIQWIYGSGFPKSLNIGKSIDKIRGNERTGGSISTRHIDGNSYGSTDKRWDVQKSKGNSEWEGWGTALKPANEPICLARKPISEKTITDNVLKWGTGGINIDGCRIETDDELSRNKYILKPDAISYSVNSNNNLYGGNGHEGGRFPSNLIIDEYCSELLGEDKSKFFYIPKVSKSERNMGLDEFEDKDKIGNLSDIVSDSKYKVKNNHPTIKPVNLMSYLCKLITPPNGTILDPFMGSGSTGISARLEGFRFVGIELDEEYFKISESRINNFELYRKFIK